MSRLTDAEKIVALNTARGNINGIGRFTDLGPLGYPGKRRIELMDDETCLLCVIVFPSGEDAHLWHVEYCGRAYSDTSLLVAAQRAVDAKARQAGKAIATKHTDLARELGLPPSRWG